MFTYLDGLGNISKNSIFKVEIEDDYLLLNAVQLRMLGKDKILQQYKIKTSDILAFEIVKAADLKDKSVIGRGAIGGLLFGPVGAVLGGMSGANKQKITSTLAICYLPSTGGEPKTVVLNAESPGWKSQNQLSIAKMQSRLNKVPKSNAVKEYLGLVENTDGSITL